MREVIRVIKVHDDLDLAQNCKEVPADQTITIGLNGKTWELDLTDEHCREIYDFFAPLIDAGRKVGGKTPTHEGPMDQKRLDYLKGLREWCRRCDIKNKAGNGWAYTTNTGTGKTYYPAWLYEKYDAYLALSNPSKVA
jgi:hypothetical protein